MATVNLDARDNRSTPTLNQLNETLARLQTKHATLKVENGERRERWRSLCHASGCKSATTSREIAALYKKIGEVGNELGVVGARIGIINQEIETLQPRKNTKALGSKPLASKPQASKPLASKPLPPQPQTPQPILAQPAPPMPAAPANPSSHQSVGNATPSQPNFGVFGSLNPFAGASVQIIVNGQLVYNQSPALGNAFTVTTSPILPTPTSNGAIPTARARSRSPARRERGTIVHREPRVPSARQTSRAVGETHSRARAASRRARRGRRSPCPWSEETTTTTTAAGVRRDGSDCYRPGQGQRQRRGRDDYYRPSGYGRLRYDDLGSAGEGKREGRGESLWLGAMW